MCRHEQEDKIF